VGTPLSAAVTVAKRRRALAVVALVPAALLLPPSAPAQAIAPGIQGLDLTATVEDFPCIIPYCSGTLGGTGTAVVMGLSTTSQPFVATWPNPRAAQLVNTSGTLFDISDFCPVGGLVPSPGGSGSGSFTLSGGLLVYQGAQQNGATFTGNFSWQRNGPDLLITVSSATVTAPNGTTVAFQAGLLEGVGSGAWVVGGTAQPTCGAPATNATIRIAANYLAPE